MDSFPGVYHMVFWCFGVFFLVTFESVSEKNVSVAWISCHYRFRWCFQGFVFFFVYPDSWANDPI